MGQCGRLQGAALWRESSYAGNPLTRTINVPKNVVPADGFLHILAWGIADNGGQTALTVDLATIFSSPPATVILADWSLEAWIAGNGRYDVQLLTNTPGILPVYTGFAGPGFNTGFAVTMTGAPANAVIVRGLVCESFYNY